MTRTSLVLRTCAEDLTSYKGFQWPESGPVEAPDWSPGPVCGGGLHGFLWGEGDGSMASWHEAARWLVVEVENATIVDLGGKIKYPRGNVVHCGDRGTATAYLAEHGAAGRAIIGGTATAGGYGTATAGDCGTATAGDSGTATAGDWGTATAGYWGTATAGDWGTATAGNSGTATAGNSGTATAGNSGTATAGYRGTATAGDCGALILRRWAGKRYKYSIAEVGPDESCKPGVAYKLNDEGEFVEARASTSHQ